MATKKANAKQLKNKNMDTKMNIGGREYELTFNFGVLGELEDLYGSVDKALNELQKGKVKAITSWIYANMILEDGNEDLNINKVGKMLDMDFINELIKKMGIAMENSFGKTEGNEEVGE